MDNSKQTPINSEGAGVKKCRDDLKKYFHPQNTTLSKKFEVIYKIFGLKDNSVAIEVGIDRTTMNRYRRGVFIPTTDMKMLISQAISKLANYPVDSAVIWGDELFFADWKENKTKTCKVGGDENETKN